MNRPNLMMCKPLLISSLLTHASRHHGETEIVSRVAKGEFHRYNYADCEKRARRVAQALSRLGIQSGDCVGTFAWNTHRHLEIYFGVSGSGAICHTINVRLHPEQLTYIVNHAEDRVVFVDKDLVPAVELIARQCPSVRHWVVLARRDEMPESKLDALICYEELLESADDSYVWPTFDENTSSGLCYTSGSTGDPKGVLYSHRSTVLHAYGSALPDALNCSGRDVILPVVPMFHVNAWGLPYIAPMVGAKLVLPGPELDSASIYRLMEAERVTFSAGVPTVWLGMMKYVEENQLRFSTLKQLAVGGAVMPAPMRRFFREQGVEAFAAWGMTETSPIGTCARPTGNLVALAQAQQDEALDKQGRVPFGVDLKIVDPDGLELPHDGVAFGELMVSGHWVISEYFKQGKSALQNGWFPTGDVATIDSDGYLHITDRLKDVIKSGGEWISSVDIEHVANAHPDVMLSACVAAPHPKWGERPVLFVVRKPDRAVTSEQLLEYFCGKIAKWSIPDAVIFVEEMPINATGKVQKLDLRKRLQEGVQAQAAP
jgi:acyl-CoA synthetase (AMP-forming)/AMP-acid ligase II